MEGWRPHFCSSHRGFVTTAPTTAPRAAASAAGVVDAALTRLAAAVDVLAEVDVPSLGEAAIRDALRRIAKVDGRLEGLQARLVAAAAAAGLPERDGAASTTAWVSQKTGRAAGQAARTDRLARTTDTNPDLADAVAEGRLGPDQAARLASGLDRGTMDPEDADHLARSAGDLPPAQFNRESKRIEGRRHQRRLREREQAAREARSVRTWRDDDDALHLEAQHAPAEGDVVAKALNAFVRPDGKEVPDHLRRTHAQLLADAMVDMCRTVLDTGMAGDVGSVRPHITITATVDAMASLEDAEAAGAVAITDLGTSLSAAAFQRLACDGTFRRLVVGPEGQPLDIGRATRKWSSAQRSAIVAADGGCRGPGCDLPPDRTEIHHLTWWRNGGGTSTDNGALLCNHGHSLVHDGGWKLTMDPGTRICRWTAPDGTVVVTHPYGVAAPSLADSLVADTLVGDALVADALVAHALGEPDPNGPNSESDRAAAENVAPGQHRTVRQRDDDPRIIRGSPRRTGPPGRGDPPVPGRQAPSPIPPAELTLDV